MDVVPAEKDFSIHVDETICSRFGEVNECVLESYPNLETQQSIADLFEESFFPYLRELTEMPDADTETMFDVSNYLYWAHMSGLNLKFELTDDDLNMITASVNNGVW